MEGEGSHPRGRRHPIGLCEHLNVYLSGVFQGILFFKVTVGFAVVVLVVF
jgi:hypothetical protein